MTVVRNGVRMGGSERFWVGKYDGGGGLSEKSGVLAGNCR